MFTQTAASPATLSTTTSSASASSPPRTGRRRGLSYLRSYTQSHLSHHLNHNPARAPSNSAPESPLSPNLQPRDPPRHPSSSSEPLVTPPITVVENSPSWVPHISGHNEAASAQGRAVSVPTTVSIPRTPDIDISSLRTEPETNSLMGRLRSSSAQHGARAGATSSFSPITQELPRTDRAVTSPVINTPTSQLSLGGLTPSTAPHTTADSSPAVVGSSSTTMPSIRFIPHQDPRASRPSLVFVPIARTLPSGTSVIRVGRYSEKDNDHSASSNAPSAAPVGFKSKVVSRRHCELWCSNGQWYIKDVKSSSGTFLNHIRLSQPNSESRPWPVNDGDVVQLGIDFKGGEEMIFRCVKIRVELNRGWQKALNNFNTTTHKRLRDLAARNPDKKEGDTASMHSSECSICLQSIAPCQSLFVAPCSHVWHYKCIRPILNAPTWPQFLCPNCRAVADLEAEVDEPEDWEDDFGDDSMGQMTTKSGPVSPQTQGLESPVPMIQSSLEQERQDRQYEDLTVSLAQTSFREGDGTSDTTGETSTTAQQSSRQSSLTGRTPNTVRSLNFPSTNPFAAAANASQGSHRDGSCSQPVHVTNRVTSSTPRGSDRSPETIGPDGPVTPTNHAGPFVFDGSANGDPLTGVNANQGDAEESEGTLSANFVDASATLDRRQW